MKVFFVLLLISVATCFADLPVFASPFIVQYKGADLVVAGSIPDPCVFDWNEDGLKDLLIGQLSGGRVRFYPNSGTNTNPVFTSFSNLMAGGSVISVSAG